jgi:YesN/AraC family two-component response regulator
VGCASLQHFSQLFRKRAGESPSEFRKRHRSR